MKNILFLIFAASINILSQGIVPADLDSDGKLEIASKENLLYISQNPSADWTADYEQTADIVFDDADFQSGGDFYNGGVGFSSIGNAVTPFTGFFDGQNHTITNLYIYFGGDNRGLFGVTNGAEILNTGLLNVYILGGTGVGGLVGYNKSSLLRNCFCTGNIHGFTAGGLAGINENSNISRCYSAGNVTGGENLGGLVGSNTAGSTIDSSYSTASISGIGNYCGGLVGSNSSSTITRSFCIGEASTSGNVAGGFVGINTASVINDCYSLGNAHAVFVSGGFVGRNETSSIINNSFSTGRPTGNIALSGFAAGLNSSSTISNCFWDKETSGRSTSVGGTGKTTAEMKSQSTFLDAGWDPAVWNIGDGINNGYPYQKWQNSGGTPLPVELSSFTAVSSKTGITLSWKTVTEVNNYGFIIERSQETGVRSQNKDWENVGFVRGNGNSNSVKEYSFVDQNPVKGKSIYRLKQIDNDGKFEYSKIVEASFPPKGGQSMMPGSFSLEQNYPNPFNPVTNFGFRISNFGLVQLKIFNSLGKEVATLVNEEKEPGTYEVEFDASSLASGVYYARLTSGEFNDVKKMILMR